MREVIVQHDEFIRGDDKKNKSRIKEFTKTN